MRVNLSNVSSSINSDSYGLKNETGTESLSSFLLGIFINWKLCLTLGNHLTKAFCYEKLYGLSSLFYRTIMCTYFRDRI
jgi:hypothetical protein